MKVTYKAEGVLDRSSGIKEIIELTVDIDPTKDSYPDTLEFLRSRILENLDEETRNRHYKLKEEFDETARKLLDITEKLESAYKQWDLVSNFLRNQGLKTDTAARWSAPTLPKATANPLCGFPQEALTNVVKSLPTHSGGYPD